MKPTRNIVAPNNNLWKAKGKVWYQKNDDDEWKHNQFKISEEKDIGRLKRELSETQKLLDKGYTDISHKRERLTFRIGELDK